MVKKVKIDLLDFETAIKASMKEDGPDEIFLDSDVERTGPEEDSSGLGGILRRLIAGEPKVVTIFGASFLLLLIAVGSVIFYHGGAEKKDASLRRGTPLAAATAKSASPRTAALTSEPAWRLDNFCVDVWDKKGNVRLLFCDIYVELGNQRIMLAEEDKVQMRKSIYNILKKKPIDIGMLIEARNLIKTEIMLELDRQLGGKSVKNIYITRFEVI